MSNVNRVILLFVFILSLACIANAQVSVGGPVKVVDSTDTEVTDPANHNMKVGGATLDDIKAAVEALSDLITSGKLPVTSYSATPDGAYGSDIANPPVPVTTPLASDPTKAGAPWVGANHGLYTELMSVGATPYSFVSTASANLTNVKSSAGTLFTITLINPTASMQYIRLYNKSSAPDPSACSANTDCPVIYSPIPTQAATTNGAGWTIPLGPVGMAFSNGIGYSISGAACTVVASCTDETNALAGVTIILGYK